MSKAQARIILAGLLHDGLDAVRLSAKAKQELRDAVDLVLELVDDRDAEG